MAFSTASFDDGKREGVNPKNLRFTQLDIAPNFSNPTHPNIKESVSLIGRGELDPAVYGYLTVHRYEHGVVWCENNRRLYVLRKAGVSSVRVKYVNNDYISRRIKEADKDKLNDLNFMPRIRGEASEDPVPSTSGSIVCQEQTEETSVLGVVGSLSAALVAGYWGWKLYKSQQDKEDDDRNKK